MFKDQIRKSIKYLYLYIKHLYLFFVQKLFNKSWLTYESDLFLTCRKLMLQSQPNVEFCIEAIFFTCHLHFSVTAFWNEHAVWKEDRETGFWCFSFWCSAVSLQCSQDSLIQIRAVGWALMIRAHKLKRCVSGEHWENRTGLISVTVTFFYIICYLLSIPYNKLDFKEGLKSLCCILSWGAQTPDSG